MIKNIEIEGFRSIKKAKIDLLPINILIGGNGSGKSNFLNFFKLLDAIYHQQLQNYVASEKVDNIFYFGRKTTKMLFAKIIFSKNISNPIADNNAYYFFLSPDAEGGLFLRDQGYGYNVQEDNLVSNYFNEYSSTESKLINLTGYRYSYLKSYLEGIQIYHFHDTSSTSKLRGTCDIDQNE